MCIAIDFRLSRTQVAIGIKEFVMGNGTRSFFDIVLGASPPGECHSFLHHRHNRWLSITSESEMQKAAFLDKPSQSINNMRISTFAAHRARKEEFVRVNANDQHSHWIRIIIMFRKTVVTNHKRHRPLWILQ